MTERDFRALSPAIAGALPKGEPLIKNNLYFVTVGADSISARFFGSIWNAPLQATFIPHGRGGACSSRKKQTTTAKHTASYMVSLLTRRGAHCASAHHGVDPRMRTTDGRPYKGMCEHGGCGFGLWERSQTTQHTASHVVSISAKAPSERGLREAVEEPTVHSLFRLPYRNGSFVHLAFSLSLAFARQLPPGGSL